MTFESSGLMMYRKRDGAIEVLLVHHGGPLWEGTDLGAWSIPKGQLEAGEEKFAAACREFEEETGFPHAGPYLDLGEVTYSSKTNGKSKVVHCFAFEGDADSTKIVSNFCDIEWPEGSGKKITIPEVDKAEFFPLEIAQKKIYKDQAVFFERLEKELALK